MLNITQNVTNIPKNKYGFNIGDIFQKNKSFYILKEISNQVNGYSKVSEQLYVFQLLIDGSGRIPKKPQIFKTTYIFCFKKIDLNYIREQEKKDSLKWKNLISLIVGDEGLTQNETKDSDGSLEEKILLNLEWPLFV